MTYNWSSGQTTRNIYHMPPGDYTVTVTDFYGCEATETIEIKCCIDEIGGIVSPGDIVSPITGVDYTINHPSSSSATDGSIIITNVQGGEPTYYYIWERLGSSVYYEYSYEKNKHNVTKGLYQVTVFDGCSSYKEIIEVVVCEEYEIEGVQEEIEHFCAYFDDNGQQVYHWGSIYLPNDQDLEFLWDDGSTDHFKDNLPVGEYFVTVTDEKQCPKEFMYKIELDYRVELGVKWSPTYKCWVDEYCADELITEYPAAMDVKLTEDDPTNPCKAQLICPYNGEPFSGFVFGVEDCIEYLGPVPGSGNTLCYTSCNCTFPDVINMPVIEGAIGQKPCCDKTSLTKDHAIFDEVNQEHFLQVLPENPCLAFLYCNLDHSGPYFEIDNNIWPIPIVTSHGNNPDSTADCHWVYFHCAYDLDLDGTPDFQYITSDFLVGPDCLEEPRAPAENTNTETNNHKIHLYPNPFSNELHVDSWVEIKSVSIYNSIGARVINIEGIGVVKNEISTGILSPGVYVINIINVEGKMSSFKMIKI